MLERNIVTGEETSKYFLHNNGLAMEWEKLAEEQNGKIEGEVNGQILEFDIYFRKDGKRIHIHQIRQLSNKHTGSPIIEKGILMTKNTRIEIQPIHTKPDNWKMVKNSGWLQFWHSVVGTAAPLGYNSNYLLVSDKKLNTSDTLTQNQFKVISESAELRRIIKKGSLLKIELYNALGTNSAMKIINSVIQPVNH